MPSHDLFSHFYPFRGTVPPGFEAWFFGVLARDWLFTGTSKNLLGGSVSVGYPAIDCEYFEWLGLMAAIVATRNKFIMVELGAGWGTWLLAAARLSAQRQIPFLLTGVEADPDHFRWMYQVFQDTEVHPCSHRLLNVAVAPKSGKAVLLRHLCPHEYYGQRLVSDYE